MENLAPDIYRQRLLVERRFNIAVGEDQIGNYLEKLPAYTALTTYGKAIVYSTRGAGRESNQGFDGFVPLIESGISICVWSEPRFFSLVIYSCKKFREYDAVKFTREFFAAEEIAYQSF